MAYIPFPATPGTGDGGGSLGPSTVGSAEIVDGSIVAVDLGLLDADGTLAANSDSKVATQKAVKTALDGKAPATRTVGTVHSWTFHTNKAGMTAYLDTLNRN